MGISHVFSFDMKSISDWL